MSDEIQYQALGEEDYIGSNVTLLQLDSKTLLRTGGALPEGVAEAMAEAEVILKMGAPATNALLEQLYFLCQYFPSEMGRAMSNMNATIAKRFEKKFTSSYAPEAIQQMEHEEEKGGW
jgi:hypothetical protein